MQVSAIVLTNLQCRAFHVQLRVSFYSSVCIVSLRSPISSCTGAPLELVWSIQLRYRAHECMELHILLNFRVPYYDNLC